MAGPCPYGGPTQTMHDAARCRDRDRCTGPGCRLRRAPREQRDEASAGDEVA